ncbi:short-chain dehydrogenase [Purpureocillium lavendulum]|uniref:Short-chain dehydrogenase n=1 Tax=Purpureocillium lavendulum TaxID=1247861 RepID=A0AB34FSM4_9HYPO|nr:short-chain dehydrogenase [Purpureocillium lavendulum]
MASSRSYDGKLGIVTGGSRGIGAAVARRFAAKGCNLLLVFTSESSRQPTDQLCRELAAAHQVRCSSVQADLSGPEAAAHKIVDAAQGFFASYQGASAGTGGDGSGSGGFQIDMLVNNAGVSSNQTMNDPALGPIVADEFTRVYNVNVLAPLLLTQAVAPFLPRDRSGRVVNVSSVSSSIGYQGQSVYAGSKAALEAMTRTWSRELAGRATVNAVNPGPAWGDMYAEAGERFWRINQPYVDAAPLASYDGEKAVLDMAGDDAERFDKTVREGMGGRRPGFTSEIAGTIDMLCSPEAGWTTGSVVCANGGMKMSIA